MLKSRVSPPTRAVLLSDMRESAATKSSQGTLCVPGAGLRTLSSGPGLRGPGFPLAQMPTWGVHVDRSSPPSQALVSPTVQFEDHTPYASGVPQHRPPRGAMPSATPPCLRDLAASPATPFDLWVSTAEEERVIYKRRVQRPQSLLICYR